MTPDRAESLREKIGDAVVSEIKGSGAVVHDFRLDVLDSISTVDLNVCDQ